MWLGNGLRTLNNLSQVGLLVNGLPKYCIAEFHNSRDPNTMGIWNPTIWNPETFEIWKHLKSRPFEGHISNSGSLAVAIALALTIRKPDHSKSGCFCPDFKWFLTKWLPFVRISNGRASGLQIPFQILTIYNRTSFWPF